MSDDEARESIAERAAEGILGPNPFIGLRPQDVVATLTALAREATSHPGLVVEQQVAFARALVGVLTDVLAGESAPPPPKGDKRFQDTAWTENPFYRACVGGYLAWTRSLNEFVDKTSFDARTK